MIVMDDPGSLIVRFYLDGPLLYLALFLAIDPSASIAKLNRLATSLATGIWRFENQLLGRPFAPVSEPKSLADSARARLVLRLLGCLLSVVSIIHFTGLAS
jgi:hypothetical protein